MTRREPRQSPYDLMEDRARINAEKYSEDPDQIANYSGVVFNSQYAV